LHQSGDFGGTQRLSFDAWTAFIRSSVGDQAEVAEPRSFAGWARPLNLCGLAGGALKIECRSAATDSGRYAYRSERRQRDVRLVGANWYYAVFQLAGRSALVQNDQAVQLAVGDVALFDAA
jgi:AraC family transcriptional regulator, positive regulator of tynA and feaB